jgi:hypothetical protein
VLTTEKFDVIQSLIDTVMSNDSIDLTAVNKALDDLDEAEHTWRDGFSRYLNDSSSHYHSGSEEVEQ